MYYFSEQHVQQIAALINSKNWSAEPSRYDFYTSLYELLTQPDAHGTDGGTDGAQLRLWLRGAAQANKNEGLFSALIRDYTDAQVELRGAQSTGDMQAASNAVADNLINTLLEMLTAVDPRAPTLAEVARADATAVGRVMFSSLGSNDTALANNAAWSGTLLFSMLGGSEVYRLYGESKDSSFNSLDDLKNAVYAIESFSKAVGSGVSLLAKSYPALSPGTAVTILQKLLAGDRPGAAEYVEIQSKAEPQARAVLNDLLVFVDTLKIWQGSAWLGVANTLTASLTKNEFSTALLDLVFKGTPVYSLYQVMDATGTSAFLDGLARLVEVPNTGMSAVFTELLKRGGEAMTFKLLNGYSASALADLAIQDRSVHRALEALSVVAVQGVTEPTVDSPADGWLQARAGMLNALVTGGIGNTYYMDKATGLSAYGQSEDGTARTIVFDASANDGSFISDTLFGTASADRLFSAGGDDLLIGGKGNDFLEGGAGADRYQHQGGDGIDILNAYGLVESDRDTLELIGSVLSEVSLSKAGGDLLIGTATGAVIVKNWFVGEAYRLKNIVFDDGPVSGEDITAQYFERGLSVSETAKLLVDLTKQASPSSLSESDIISTLFKDGKLWSSEYLSRLGVLPGAQPGLLDPRHIEQLLYDAFVLGNGAKSDPLILDLNGDGIQTVGVSAGVHFDLDDNRFRETTGWTKPSDGFLALDLNGNGKIDSGAELFGDRTQLPNGHLAHSGFEALTALDSSGNGVVDSQDRAWSKLKIWRDANSDGVSSGDEILGMTEAGIQSISLQYQQHTNPLDTGNQNFIAQSGSFVRTDGSSGAVAALLFMRNSAASIAPDGLAVSAEVAKLPDIKGMGVVYDLRQAMMRDPVLVQLVQNFVVSRWDSADSAFDNVLTRWARVDNVSPGSRGPNVNAQHLAVLEQFYGQPYIDSDGTGNPRQNQGYVLEFAYNAVKESIYSAAMAQGPLAPYFGTLSLKFDSQGALDFNAGGLTTALKSKFLVDPDEAAWLVFSTARALHGLGLANSAGYAEFVQSFDAADAVWHIPLYADGRTAAVGSSADDNYILSNFGDVLFAGAGADQVKGGAKNDYIAGGVDADELDGGAGDDYLAGGAGDDRLSDSGGSNVFRGDAGKDILGTSLTTSFWGPNVYYGGTGNDLIYGSRGADTYIFNKGDGQDVIRENPYNGGGDVLKFGPDILPADWTASRAGVDLVLSDARGLDKITLAQWFDSADQKAYRIDRAEFADGTTWSATEMTERALTLYGTAAADVLKGLAGIDDVIHGLAGDDSIFGYAGNDKLYGDDGADTSYGGAGNDTLQGGAGNDNLDGEAGNDHLDGGAGDDRLYDAEGANTFEGGDGNDIIMSASTTAFFGPNTYIGGRGADIIYGSRGGDTYIFNIGDGQDIIRENPYSAGGDVVRFGASIQANDWTVSRVGTSLVVSDATGRDRLTFEQWFESPDLKAYRVDRFEFADGTVWANADVSDRALTLFGTDAGDYLRGLPNSNDIIHGLGGADTAYGYSGADTLYGDAGDDILYGGEGSDALFGGDGADRLDGESGDDFLSGGAGADRLYDTEGSNTFDGGDGDDWLMNGTTTAFRGPNTYIGGKGNDTIFGSRGGDIYLFSLGDGQDLIRENRYGSDTDIVKFGGGISAADFAASRVGDSLILQHLNGVDKLTFQDWFYTPTATEYQVERFEFADGSVLTGTEVASLIGTPSLAPTLSASMFT